MNDISPGEAQLNEIYRHIELMTPDKRSNVDLDSYLIAIESLIKDPKSEFEFRKEYSKIDDIDNLIIKELNWVKATRTLTPENKVMIQKSPLTRALIALGYNNRGLDEEPLNETNIKDINDRNRFIMQGNERREQMNENKFNSALNYARTLLKNQSGVTSEERSKRLTTLLRYINSNTNRFNSPQTLSDAWQLYTQIIPVEKRVYTDEEQFNTTFKTKKDLIFQLTALGSTVTPRYEMADERDRTIGIIEKLTNINDQNLNRSPYVMGLESNRRVMYDEKKQYEMKAKEVNPTYYQFTHTSGFFDNSGSQPVCIIPIVSTLKNSKDLTDPFAVHPAIYAIYINYKATATGIYDYIEFGYHVDGVFVKLLRYKRFPTKGIKLKIKAWWGYNETWRKALYFAAGQLKFAVRVGFKAEIMDAATWAVQDGRFSVNASWMDSEQILPYLKLIKDIRTATFKITNSKDNSYKRSLQKFVNYDNKLLDNLGRMIGKTK
jgi:hypothetical protein